jgi:hypothetical protein
LVHGTVKGLFKLLGAVGMLVVVLSAWLVYRVSEGPLSLSALTPYIEAALSRPDEGIGVTVQDTILAWSRDTHSLEIEGVGVILTRNGAEIASLPELSVRLSGNALLRGKLVARAIRLLHPGLSLVRDEEGVISFGIGGDGGGGTALADVGVDALLAPPGRETLAGQLQSIQIVDAQVALEDRKLGISWTAPRADFTFSRDSRGIALSARLDLLLDGRSGHLDADGVYAMQGRSLDLKLWGGGVTPSSLARLTPQLDFLSAVRFPIGGQVTLTYRLGDGITSLSADVAAGEGTLDLTPVAGFAMPVKSVGLKAAFHKEELELQQFRVDLGGTVLTADGKITDLAGAMRTSLRFRADGAALDALPAIWPKPLAPHPRAWIAANLTHGRIQTVAGTLNGHVPAGKGVGDFIVDALDGSLNVDDATVRYMPTMPKVEHVAASANFDADKFTIDLAGGEAANLTLPTGKVVLKGLSKPDQDADITLKIDGSVADVLRFIDHPPLGWTSKFGIDPNQIGGDAELLLSLKFPLVENLSLDKLAIRVEADDRGLSMPKVLQDLDLTDGMIHFSVDNNGLDAAGTAQLDHRPAAIRWRENFAKAAFRSRYQVAAQLSDEGRRLAGLGAAPFQPPYLKGAAPVEIAATMLQPGRWDVGVKADLTPVELVMPGLNYAKAAGAKAQATADFQLVDNKMARVQRFRVNGDNNLDVSGDVAFDKDGEIRRVNLPRATFARSELSGAVTFRTDGGLAVTASGPVFDGREIVADRPTDPATDKLAPRPPLPPRSETAPPPPPKEVTPLSIEARFDKVWLSDQGFVTGAAADLVRDHLYWRRAHISAETADHRRLTLDLHPTDDAHSSVVLDSDDAGGVFRAMDVFDNMRGGKMKLNAVYDDKAPGRPLSGRLKVEDFQLENAPVLAKLLTVAGLTGILDLMSGQGIHFDKLDMPFSYVDGWLAISDGQAAGSALGFTAKGRIDLQTDRSALEGTLVPAYAINSVLGGIPILGPLLAPEKGGGIIAMNFQMKGPTGDPSFTVNPLSALTPGFLRHLFDIFDQKPAEPK